MVSCDPGRCKHLTIARSSAPRQASLHSRRRMTRSRGRSDAGERVPPLKDIENLVLNGPKHLRRAEFDRSGAGS